MDYGILSTRNRIAVMLDSVNVLQNDPSDEVCRGSRVFFGEFLDAFHVLRLESYCNLL